MNAKENLGPHPVFAMSKFSIALFFITLMFSSVFYLSSIELGNYAMNGFYGAAIVIFIFFILTIFINKKCIKNYNYSKDLLCSGFSLNYVARDRFGHSIVMVDDAKKIISFNGECYKFPDIRYINSGRTKGRGGYVEILMRFGEDPVKLAVLDNYEEARKFHVRLANSLNLNKEG